MKNNSEIEQFAKRLKELRIESGFTQNALAFEAGVGIRTIRRLEKGEQVASLDIIISLCKAFKLTLSDFFEGIEIEFEFEE